ncbi:MAG: ComF family protein [Idiomarina sp.]|nr:ComF family protein [Idiomarina sp.]
MFRHLKLPPQGLRYACSALWFQPPVTRWLYAFKFHGDFHYAKALATLLAAQVIAVYRAEKLQLPEVLIPVPMAASRLRERGYNQATLIAQEVATLLGIPLLSVGRHQGLRTSIHALNAADRKKALEGAFACNHAISHQRVALVDDVLTTGATVDAFAQCLGKRRRIIDCWTVAFTPPPLASLA